MKTILTGNTCETIDECMAYLYRVEDYAQFCVSMIFGYGEHQVCVGNDLELPMKLMQRWWERNDSHQLKLPFALYQPAKVLAFNYSPSRRTYDLKIKYHCEDRVITSFKIESPTQSIRFGIRAIRIHKVQSRSQFVNLSAHAAQAAKAGLIVLLPSGAVYNKDTGEYVGSNLRIISTPVLVSEHSMLPSPTDLAELRLPNGESLALRVTSVNYREVDEYNRLPRDTPEFQIMAHNLRFN